MEIALKEGNHSKLIDLMVEILPGTVQQRLIRLKEVFTACASSVNTRLADENKKAVTAAAQSGCELP